MTADGLRARLAELVRFAVPAGAPELRLVDERSRDGYDERLVTFTSPAGGDVPALLLWPHRDGPLGGVVAYHQHNSEWHLGKSEVAGLAGEAAQALGPVLARRGVAVLAPDQIGFEDRRATGPGAEVRHDDWLQYYNAMGYRLLDGELLVTTVLADAAHAVSVLGAVDGVDASRVGVAGHSMGGNTALLHAALDERVAFACSSGAAATFRAKEAAGTGLEMAQVVPGLRRLTDVDDIAALIAPRPLLLVSATEDEFSVDADVVAEHAARAYAALGAPDALRQVRFEGGHALTPDRLELIADWLAARVVGS